VEDGLLNGGEEEGGQKRQRDRNWASVTDTGPVGGGQREGGREGGNRSARGREGEETRRGSQGDRRKEGKADR